MRARHARGLGMAELMVAMAVGLLVLLLAAAMLVASNRAYVAQADAAEVEEGGRYALEAIARAARQAAFVNWDSGETGIGHDPTAAPRIAGLDDHAVTRASNAIDQPVAGAVNGSDVLALRFAGAGAAGGDGSMTSCAGFSVGHAGEGWSIFYVATAATGDAELRCKYRGAAGWGADAIVGGVDSFQVLYGLDTDAPPDGLANLYVRAGVVQALDDALLLAGADAPARERDLRRKTHWKRIASLKVGLVLHGHKRSPSPAGPAVYDLFGRAYADAQGASDVGTRISEAQLPEDLRARERRLFATTIVLRNRID
jgi:type IV pilus assembly protein PilW